MAQWAQHWPASLSQFSGYIVEGEPWPSQVASLHRRTVAHISPSHSHEMNTQKCNKNLEERKDNSCSQNIVSWVQTSEFCSWILISTASLGPPTQLSLFGLLQPGHLLDPLSLAPEFPRHWLLLSLSNSKRWYTREFHCDISSPSPLPGPFHESGACWATWSPGTVFPSHLP